MTKILIILIYIAIAILVGGCYDSEALSVKKQADSLNASDTKYDLNSAEETFAGFDYETVISDYSPNLPSGFKAIRYRYFVIFSELDEKLTADLIVSDIRNAIDAMTGNYVNKTPTSVTPLIIFKEIGPYKNFVLKNFDIPEDDISPYGFFKISKNVIIIRYVNWKGSIPHEVTHKFTNTDFPDMPSWFDEGLSSLHEKSTFKNGDLEGDFSLRIIPLRRAIDEDTYTGLEHLMKTNDDEFYGKRSPYYYAQSRYLLMYLQQNGLLKDYYRTFRDTYNKDKTGISQLEKITGNSIETLNDEVLAFIRSFDNN